MRKIRDSENVKWIMKNREGMKRRIKGIGIEKKKSEEM